MSEQIILLSVTKLGEILAISIGSKLTGKIPVFLKPLWMFATVMAHDQAGQNTSQKEPLGRTFALVQTFHSMRYLCHSFLNWANGVESKAWTLWLVWGGIAITWMLFAFMQSKKATL